MVNSQEKYRRSLKGYLTFIQLKNNRLFNVEARKNVRRNAQMSKDKQPK